MMVKPSSGLADFLRLSIMPSVTLLEPKRAPSTAKGVSLRDFNDDYLARHANFSGHIEIIVHCPQGEVRDVYLDYSGRYQVETHRVSPDRYRPYTHAYIEAASRDHVPTYTTVPPDSQNKVLLGLHSTDRERLLVIHQLAVRAFRTGATDVQNPDSIQELGRLLVAEARGVKIEAILIDNMLEQARFERRYKRDERS